MKSVLLSIKPKYCELIVNGKKTVEVRKIKPKIETPFKCYIYCTLPPKEEQFRPFGIIEYAHELIRLQSGEIVYDYGMRLACDDREYTKDNFLCKKVIGEFVCKLITGLRANNGIQTYYNGTQGTCLTDKEIIDYAKGKMIYYWHISDLVIYDKPKELSEFYTLKKCNSCKYSGYESAACIYDDNCVVPVQLKRPPQSWCYVEVIK